MRVRILSLKKTKNAESLITKDTMHKILTQIFSVRDIGRTELNGDVDGSTN